MTAGRQPFGAATRSRACAVLDFSIMLAGPYCARLCADMGAEVLKDRAARRRRHAPARAAARRPERLLRPAQRRQRSLALDLKLPEAIALARRLVGRGRRAGSRTSVPA